MSSSYFLRRSSIIRARKRFSLTDKPCLSHRSWTTLTTNRDSVTIHALNHTSFPYIWLRDSCQSSPTCIHPTTKQKLHRTSDIPLSITPVETSEGIQVLPEGLMIKWTDGHESFFDTPFLEKHAHLQKMKESHYDNTFAAAPWTSESIRKVPELFMSYDSLKTPQGLADGMTQLLKYGLLFVRDVPIKETDNEACELKVLGERFGELRNTFYGLLWDVVNVNESKNIAYTNLGLGFHMDLLYFQHPPRYQILQCLRNRVIGGTSIFVDGLSAALSLYKTHPGDFDVLTKTPVAYHYINDGHHLHHEHPTIQLAPADPFSSSSSMSEPQILHINYSPPFQAPLPLSTPAKFYPSLQRFTALLNDPANTYSYTLKEGDAVLFDNRRVLHARTAFQEKEKRSEGWEEGVKFGKGEERTNRWLKGCYLEADAILDRMRVGRRNLGGR